jgi:hypothetical protein
MNNFTSLLYYGYRLHSTQFVAQIYHTFPFTTRFGLMGPSSGTLGFYNRLFSFCCSPHTGQCLHIGSSLYVWSFYDALCVNYEYGSDSQRVCRETFETL